MNSTILTILSLSASGSVLALIILAMRPLLKNKVSKTFQYYIWLLVLLRMIIPLSFDGSIMSRIISETDMTQVQLVSTSHDGDDRNETMQGNSTSQGNEQNTSQVGTQTETANAAPNSNILSASEPIRYSVWRFALEHMTSIWFLGAVLYFSRFFIAYLRFSRKLRKTSIQPHVKDTEVYLKLRGNTRVQLCCNPYIDTPMLIGLLSPCIVIPHLKFVENGMKSELQHILRHELTHYRRRDLIYKWFVVLVSALHWYNPLMILVRREIGRTCELSCDETVIRFMDADQRQNYGETLLAIASSKRLSNGIVTTAMCEGKRELKERLESIMIFKNKSVVMAALSLVLALLLVGCSVALGAVNVSPIPDEATQSPVTIETPNVSTSPDVEASQSPAATDASGVQTTPSFADKSVLEAYSAVVREQAEFYSTDNKQNLKLNDFLTNKELYGTAFTVTRFTVLDMDGDKMPEVILELSVGSEPQFYEVLHFMDGTVHGYLVPFRGLEDLKEDGTFGFSNGAADNGWGKLGFGATAYTTDMLGYSQSSFSDTNLTIAYFMNNQPVTKETFDSFASEQSEKKDAVWYEFSQQNIEAELSANP